MPSLSKVKNRVVLTPNLGITATFGTARAVEIPLYQSSPNIDGNDVRWEGVIESIVVNYTTATGIASILTFLSKDAAGDSALTPSVTTSAIQGTTTTTSGCIRVDYNLTVAIVQTSLWLFLRTNAATCTVTSIEVTWRE